LLPRKTRTHALIFATICIVMVVILGIIIMENSLSSKTGASAASVRGLGAGIYWDQGCTNRTVTYDWGPLRPGSNKTVTVYVRNEGDSATYLSLATSKWTPAAALGYITLDWNYAGQILSVDQVIPLELVLTVSPTISGITHFSLETTIATTS